MRNSISYKVRSDGEEFSQGFKIKSIMVLNEANRIPRAHILLLDGDVSEQDFKISNMDFFKPGKVLEIDLGYEGDVAKVFKGLIVKHGIKINSSNNSYLEIECKHKAVKLSVNRKNCFFHDSTDNEAISQILSEADISNAIDGMSDFTHKQLVQYECSSWDFMLSRVDANGHLALFENEKIKIAPPSMEGDPLIECTYGDNVISFNAGMDGENHFKEVESQAWSSANQGLVETNGNSSFINEIGNISSEELAEVLNEEAYFLQHPANIPEDELSAWAKSKATKNELSKIIGSVRIRGNASVFPGGIILLKGFGERFSGNAYVTGIRHEISDGNWTTDIQFGLPSTWFAEKNDFHALPASGLLPAVNGLQIGVVTQLESDPENEFQIRVRLPMVNNEDEGLWAQMIHSYAGDNYGACFYPEIGDEVIVSFLNDDPRKAVILGMLHSSAKPSPIAPSDENHLKAIITRSNIKIEWDDKKKCITISTPDGARINLESKMVSISDQNQNRIEMTSQGITIESANNLILKAAKDIDLNGLNISSKATGRFAAEGTGGAEVKTSAIAILKGSLVQIN